MIEKVMIWRSEVAEKNSSAATMWLMMSGVILSEVNLLERNRCSLANKSDIITDLLLLLSQ